MRIKNNKVLILPDGHFNKDGDFELFDAFEPAKHFSVMGTIMVLPEKLLYYGKEVAELRKNRNPETTRQIQEMMGRSMEFGTTIGDAQVGDRVAFRFMNHLNAIEEGSWVDMYGLGKALLIDWDQLYCRIGKEGNMIMLNGWIMVEPIEHTLEEMTDSAGILVLQKDIKKPGVGIVRIIGEPNFGDTSGGDMGPDVNVGDVVLFRHSNNVPIEWAYHKVLNDGKYPFYRMQRKDILAIR